MTVFRNEYIVYIENKVRHCCEKSSVLIFFCFIVWNILRQNSSIEMDHRATV